MALVDKMLKNTPPSGEIYVPSPEEVASVPWTKYTLATWGVPWPPPHGWRRGLEYQWQRLEREGKAVRREVDQQVSLGI